VLLKDGRGSSMKNKKRDGRKKRGERETLLERDYLKIEKNGRKCTPETENVTGTQGVEGRKVKKTSCGGGNINS